MNPILEEPFRSYLMERRRLIKDELASIERMLGMAQKEKQDTERIDQKTRLGDLTNLTRRVVR